MISLNNAAIGVFDSGIGGLTAVKELNRLLPYENIIYFGDTARLPYGTRSRETILEYARQDIAFIKTHPVKLIIAACGTISSVMGSGAELCSDIPFIGVLKPAVQAACTATRVGKIGVIGTPATIKSGSYGRAIRAIRPDLSIIGNACPLFVPLVENGFTDRNNEVTRLVAKQYLAPIIAEGVDTLIMGCTHYPVIRDIISDIMGPDVTLISPGEEAAKIASGMLTSQELLNDSTEQGTNRFFVSDSTDMFMDNASAFFGGAVSGEVSKAEVDSL